MKVKYNRVKANSCKEIIFYIKKGYSPFVIDCSSITNMPIEFSKFYLGNTAYMNQNQYIRKQKNHKYGQVLENYFYISNKFGYELRYLCSSLIKNKKYKVIPNGYFIRAVQYYDVEDIYEYKVNGFYKELEKGSELEDPECNYVLGKLLLKGIHYKQDIKEGIRLLTKASKMHPGAKDVLGNLYLEGKYIKQNKKLGNKLIEQSEKYDYYDFFKEHPHFLDLSENEYSLSSEIKEHLEVLKKLNEFKPVQKVILKTYQDCEKYLFNRKEFNVKIEIDNVKSKKLFAYLKDNKNKDDNHEFAYAYFLSTHYFDEIDEKEIFDIYYKLYNKGYLLSINPLAVSYYYGTGCEIDHKRSFELFKEGEEKGLISCIINMAKVYLNPNNIEYSEEKFKECCFKLLNKKAFQAAHWFYYGYVNGVAFNKDRIHARNILDLYKKLDDEDLFLDKIQFDIMDYNQKWVLAPKEHEIVNMYKKLYKKYNSSKALIYLGYFYKQKKKYKNAMKCFILASEKGNRQANTEIGLLYEFGLGVDKNSEKAIEYYLQSGTNKGLVYNNLGVKFYEGKGVTLDLNKAFDLFFKAYKFKDEMAYKNLARCYFKGEGVEINYQKGLEIIKEGMNNNSGPSYLEMSKIYKDGKYGIEKNKEKCIECINKAIECKYYDAYISKAFLYIDGTYSKDENEFYKCIIKAHELNVLNLDYYYGIIYANGYGIKKNLKKAITYFEKSIKDDYSLSASYNYIGACYEELEDYENAIIYYSKGIELENKYSYFNLGNLYLYGKGVNKDLIKAKELFVKAKELGHENSDKKLEFINKQK